MGRETLISDYQGSETVISLVLPTYNPGPAVERRVLAIRDTLRFRPEPWEILFVCDGCTDGTPERLSACLDAIGDARLRVVAYSQNRGKGYAVRYGLTAARGHWRIFTDIDLHFLDGLNEAIDSLQEGVELVIASRAHRQSEFVAPFSLLHYIYRRKIQSLAFSRVVRTILPIPFRDTQAGLKGMSADVAEKILPHLRCDGFAFDCELLLAAEKLGIRVQEVPVRVRYEDDTSTTGSRTALRMIRELWRIRRDWRTSPPPRQALPVAEHTYREAA